MPTSEEIGEAMERGAVAQALDPFASDKIYNDPELNKRIMTPQWDNSKITIMKPVTEMEMVWMPVIAQNGEPKLHEGLKVVQMKKIPIFSGWNKKEIEIPAGNLFKTDLTTAISSEMDVNMLNKLINLYFYVIELSIATGQDYSYDLYKIYSLIGGILNTSKSKYGKTLEMMKTSISRGYQENTLKQMLLSDQHRKGIFGNIKSKLHL